MRKRGLVFVLVGLADIVAMSLAKANWLGQNMFGQMVWNVINPEWSTLHKWLVIDMLDAMFGYMIIPGALILVGIALLLSK